MSKTAIRVKDGKLYNGDKEIRPEIGNSEHIKALKDYQSYAQLLEEGCELMFWHGDIEDEIKGGINCLCGHDTEWRKMLADHEDESHFAAFLMRKKTVQCEKCNRKYRFYAAEFGIGIKLIKKT